MGPTLFSMRFSKEVCIFLLVAMTSEHMEWLKILRRASIAASRSSCMDWRSMADGDGADGGVEGDASKPGAAKAGVPAAAEEAAAAAGPRGVAGAAPWACGSTLPEEALVAADDGVGDPAAARARRTGRGSSGGSERCAE
eukprot:2579653-Heterocapsa_arctica.AAC.1